MKAFNNFLEEKLVEIRNNKFERESLESNYGKYSSISRKQADEENCRIKLLEYVLSDEKFLCCNTFNDIAEYANTKEIEGINSGYVYNWLASYWSEFNSGNILLNFNNKMNDESNIKILSEILLNVLGKINDLGGGDSLLKEYAPLLTNIIGEKVNENK